MEKKEYKYNAFISYRHNDLDKFVAENLHRLIETYKMPKPVVAKYNITDKNIRRVFRDQDELPISSNLENPIIEAIKQSKFLIVICSPRLRESIWCKREIENFIKFHGRANILCVLVEGEPQDSFPEELLSYEEKTVDENGKEITKIVKCEPLAMDVRGADKKEISNNLKRELIRIIAPMYNLDYDDIKRRHEERQMQKKIKVFRTIAIISIIFTIYSGVLFFKIYKSSEQLKYDQAISLATASKELLEKDNRKEALEKAYESVTQYNNNKMPVTSEGIYELTESLGVYYTSDNYYALSKLDTLGIVQSIKTDLDMKYLLSYDSSREFVLWNLETEKRIKTITDAELSITEYKYTFIGNKGFAYQNINKELVIVDLNGNEVKKINLGFPVSNMCSSANGKYLVITNKNKISVYNTDSYEQISEYEFESNMEILSNLEFNESEENIVFAIQDKSIEKLTNINNEIELIAFNISDKSIMSKIKLNSYEVNKIIFDKENVYVLSNGAEKLRTGMNLIYYNYKNGNEIFNKQYDSAYPLALNLNSDTLLVSSWGISYLLDAKTGEERAKFAVGSKVVDSYVIIGSKYYMLFTSNGEVHVINAEVNGLNNEDNNVVYTGLYNFNLPLYNKFLNTTRGIVAFANNDNKIIIYGKLKNDDIKEITYTERKFDVILSSNFAPIIEEYNFSKKNLIANIFYSDDKKLLFVCYTDNTMEIYNNESKKILNTVKNTKQCNIWLGKTDEQYRICIRQKSTSHSPVCKRILLYGPPA
ncbi:MAG: TIR domain-containing protein, partial [Clostridia bacterium]|nr:TIR domain-containing protein [Clostridia bacterium]